MSRERHHFLAPTDRACAKMPLAQRLLTTISQFQLFRFHFPLQFSVSAFSFHFPFPPFPLAQYERLCSEEINLAFDGVVGFWDSDVLGGEINDILGLTVSAFDYVFGGGGLFPILLKFKLQRQKK